MRAERRILARRPIVLSLSLGLLCAACGGGAARDSGAAPAPPPAVVDPPVVEVSPTPASPAPEGPGPQEAPPAIPDLDAVAVRLTEVATLDAPSAMAMRPGDDAFFIAERAGAVRVLRDGERAPQPLVDITGETTTDGERGLLGLAFSPDGERLYLSFTDTARDTRIDEWTLDGDGVRADSRRTVFALDQPYANHNGGHITFGPDGFLYIGLGDGGSAGDPLGAGQSLDTLLGALLRIDPLPREGAPYAVPADNPFVEDPAARDEIWVYGLRNPWRFSFDRATGDLWVADVGQNEREEVTVLPAGSAGGANLGWNVFEGTQRYAGEPSGDEVPPLTEYSCDEGCSVTGGFVYRGEAIPALRGAYVYGDFCSGFVRAVAQEDGAVVAEADLGVEVESLVSFGEDADGELYALSLSGGVFRVDPA